MATIEQDPDVLNVGPVSEFTFPKITKGILVIKGANGSGKSHLLDSIDSALRGKGALVKKDGAPRGRIRFRGVTLTVQKATRRDGTLECTALDGDLNISSLINPELKSPDAADARRIKTLVALSGVEADQSLFHELAGGKERFEALVKPGEAEDIVTLAARVKRDLEAEARKEEGCAEREAGHVAAFKEQAAGVDLDAEADDRKLRDAIELAIATEARLKAEATAAHKAHEAARLASDALEDAAAEFKGRELAAIQRAITENNDAAATWRAEVTKRKVALEEAENELDQRETYSEHLHEELETVESHEKTIAAWRKTIADAKGAKAIPVDVLDAAAQAVTQARAADHLGVKVREARAALVKADEAADKAKTHRKRAEQLRDGAKGTDDVLSGLVGKLNCPLRVKDGRLVLDTDRGEELFADLSDGERSKVAVGIGAGLLSDKRDGTIVIEQRIWQDLDLTARKEVAGDAESKGVLIVTAECDHSVEGQPLRAERFEANGTH